MSLNKLLFLCISISFLLTQDLNINGKVVNESGVPVAGVNIFCGAIGTTSASDGSFFIKINTSSIVTFKHISYMTATYAATEIPKLIILNKNILKSDQILVSGGIQNVKLSESHNAVDIVTSNKFRFSMKNHFEDFIYQIPNLTYASGTSNPRYFLIRGIGEISQFATEGNPNFSVGYIIDNVDLSGIGSIGSTFGIEQIEVFKGPQNYMFGPNAMAGVINFKSLDTTPYFSGTGLLGFNSDNGYNLGLTISNTISRTMSFRLTAFKNYTNGFKYNDYHKINNSNKNDEFLTRFKVIWQINKNLRFNLNQLFSLQNNGYDTWSPNNNVDTTYTDFSGIDSLSTKTLSLESIYTIKNNKISSILSYSNNDLQYNFDGDWGNNEFWEQSPYNWYENNEIYFSEDACNEYYGYYPCYEDWSFEDKTKRNRKTLAHDLKFSTEKNIILLIFGIYNKRLEENDVRDSWLFGGKATNTETKFNINSHSIYGNIAFIISDYIQLNLGTRYSIYSNDYHGIGEGYDENWNIIPIESLDTIMNNNLFSYHLSIKQKFNNNKFQINSSINRGYKFGGINQNPYLPDEQRIYLPEFNLNLTNSLIYLSKNYETQIDLFYMKRFNQQVGLYYQVNDNDPTSFSFYTANAEKGYNVGLESKIQFKLNKNISIIFSNGLLKNYVSSFRDPFNTEIIYGDRTPAHSPLINHSIIFNFNITEKIILNLENTGMNEFYIDDQSDQKTTPFNISNFNISYNNKNINYIFWGKNIFDKKYIVRGYWFDLGIGNDGEKFYKMYGDPSHYGLSIRYNF